MSERNFYRENRYPRNVIANFARSQENLSQSSRLFAFVVQKDPFFAERIKDGSIDLIYRFHDRYSDKYQQYPPALCFRYLDSNTGNDEYMLVYIDPSITFLWEEAMDIIIEDDCSF